MSQERPLSRHLTREPAEDFDRLDDIVRGEATTEPAESGMPSTEAGRALLYNDASEEWIDMMRPSILAIEEQARVAPDERLREALVWTLNQLGAHVPKQRASERSYKQGYADARALLATPPDPAPDERLLGLISQALSELGVPTPDYPAPIANAVAILQTAWPDVAEPKPASPAVEGE